MVPVCSSLFTPLIFLILFFDCKEQKSKYMPLKNLKNKTFLKDKKPKIEDKSRIENDF